MAENSIPRCDLSQPSNLGSIEFLKWANFLRNLDKNCSPFSNGFRNPIANQSPTLSFKIVWLIKFWIQLNQPIEVNPSGSYMAFPDSKISKFTPHSHHTRYSFRISDHWKFHKALLILFSDPFLESKKNLFFSFGCTKSLLKELLENN